jgi:hypothetical protein
MDFRQETPGIVLDGLDMQTSVLVTVVGPILVVVQVTGIQPEVVRNGREIMGVLVKVGPEALWRLIGHARILGSGGV